MIPHTYAILITFIIVWAPTMEWTIQDQSHTLNLTQHDNTVLELTCKVPSLQGLRTVYKLEIRVQNSTTSQEVPVVALTFDNEIFPDVSLDPLARVKGQMDSKDPSKCSLQVIQPLRCGVYRCSIDYDNGSPSVKSFQVNVVERHEQSNNGSFMVTVLPAIVVKATWIQPLTSKLDEVSLTQFTIGEAGNPVGQTVLYVNNTTKNPFESELVLLSLFSNRVHAGQENKSEVSLYLRSDPNSKNTNYSVSVSSSSEGLRRISGLKEITCEIQSDQVRSYLVELVCVSVVLSCTCVGLLCIIFAVLYIRTCKSSKSSQKELNISDSIQISPNVPDTRTQTSPNVPDTRTQTSPNVPDTRTQTSPNVPDTRTQTSPNVPDTRTQTSPNVPDTRTQTSPNVPDTRTQTSPNVPDTRTQTSPNVPDTRTQTSPNVPDTRTQTSPNVPDIRTQTSPNVPDTRTQTSPNVPDTRTQTSPNVPDTRTQTSPNVPDTRTQTFPNVPDTRTQTFPNVPDTRTQTSPHVPDTKTQTSPHVPDTRTQTSPNVPDIRTQTSPNVPDTRTQTSPNVPDTRTQTSPNVPYRTQRSPNLFDRTQSDSVAFGRSQVTYTYKFEILQPENPHPSLTTSTRNRRKRNKHHRTKDTSGASADTDLGAVGVNPNELNSDDESAELISGKEVMDGPNTDKSDSDYSVNQHETNRPA